MGLKAVAVGQIAQHFVRARWRWSVLHGEALERYQERRAHTIVSHAHQRAPFYRQHWADHDLTQWRTLPTVDKRLMMTHFATFNTRSIATDAAMDIALRAERSGDFAPTIGGLTVGLSSGTSGHRGLFLVSQSEQTGWAGVLLARALHTWKSGLRVAFFLRANSNLYEQIGTALIQFRYFDLMQPLPESIEALNTLQPHILVGPPSLLGMLAAAQSQGKLRIQPQRLISVAEVLEAQDRDHLTEVFNAPVHQIYQCTEGLLAVSCAAGSLHIQEDLVALQCEPLPTAESLPSASQRVTPIVTDLWRRTQPIIRYRLNDVLRLAPKPCSCGSAFRVIENIEGRCDDTCAFPDAEGAKRLFYPDTIRRMILLASPNITDYAAVQERPGHLRIYLETLPGADIERIAADVQDSVQAITTQYACRAESVEVVQGLPATRPGAKRRRVQRLY